MVELVISDEQARMLTETGGVVVIRDQNGNVVGSAFRTKKVNPLSRFTPQQLADLEARSQSDGPWLTTAQVLDHLRSLDK